MKKIIMAILFAVVLCISVSAVNGSVDELTYKITGDDIFTAMFDVTADSETVAVVSVYNDSGRFISSKIVKITATGSYTANFDNINDIGFAKINLFESSTTLSPVCEQKTVKNYISTGDSFIPVGSLFQD